MNPMTDDNEAAAQVILAKLLEIYDVKTLVAHLNGVGEKPLESGHLQASGCQ